MRGVRGTNLHDRVLAYFKANPSDSLTLADACIKFDAEERKMRETLGDLCKGGQVKLMPAEYARGLSE